MAKDLKVGIIGVGGIAKTHVPGWKASPHTEIVAACDIVESTVQAFGAEHGIARLCTDSAELINDPSIDIIDVCTPNNFHAPLTIAALNAGKHVICEKPLAPTPADVKAMIEARNRSGKLLMTAQHFRFRGSSKAMKREIDGGALGNVYHARSWMLRRCIAPTPLGFITKKLATGGPTIDIGVHILDLTLWLMGNPEPVAVTGVARAELAHLPGAFTQWKGGLPIPPEYDVEDFAAAFVRFKNGATLVLEVSWLLHHDTAGEDMQMWLYGTKAGCQWPKCEFYESNYATRQHYNRSLKLLADQLEPHAQECVEFAQAVVDGAKVSPVPAEQSLQVMTILDGIYRSQVDGREVLLG